jgi:hypothetical protein
VEADQRIAESNNAAIGRLRSAARGFQDPNAFITMILLDRADLAPDLALGNRLMTHGTDSCPQRSGQRHGMEEPVVTPNVDCAVGDSRRRPNDGAGLIAPALLSALSVQREQGVSVAARVDDSSGHRW